MKIITTILSQTFGLDLPRKIFLLEQESQKYQFYTNIYNYGFVPTPENFWIPKSSPVGLFSRPAGLLLPWLSCRKSGTPHIKNSEGSGYGFLFFLFLPFSFIHTAGMSSFFSFSLPTPTILFCFVLFSTFIILYFSPCLVL